MGVWELCNTYGLITIHRDVELKADEEMESQEVIKNVKVAMIRKNVEIQIKIISFVTPPTVFDLTPSAVCGPNLGNNTRWIGFC